MSKLAKTLQAAAGNAGEEATYVEDVFSTYLYTGNGSTQTIENGIALGDSNFGGSGVFTSGDYLEVTPEVIGAGDFTIEFWVNHDTTTSYQTAYVQGYGMAGSLIIQTGNSDGKWLVYIEGSVVLSETTSTVNTNTWYHIALTRSGSTIRLFRDGVQTGSGTSSVDVNFSGAASISYPIHAFVGRVSNFRYVKGTALYTSAFTPPTSALTAISGTKLLTLQGDTPFLDNSTNALSITNVGTVSASKVGPYTEAGYGEGGLVWIKGRNAVTNHALIDTERGGANSLASDTTAAQRTDGAYGLTFNSDGFDSTGGNLNVSGREQASWTFRKAPKFFDVVTWTGDDTTNRTHAHNLGSVPGLIIVKATSRSSNWTCYHRSLGNTKGLSLNSTDAAYNTTAWNSTSPTDSVFTATSGTVNEGGQTYVAYLFAHDAGGFGDDGEQNVISCGSYTGNGSTDGPEIDLGWEPQFLMFKRATGGTANWMMVDNMRGLNVTGRSELMPNLANAEYNNTTSTIVEPTSTGFKLTANTTQTNTASSDYIYIAIRRPMKTPESGTEVFNVQRATNSGTSTTPEFITDWPIDLSIYKADNVGDTQNSARLIQGKRLKMNSTVAEDTSTNDVFDFNNGTYNNALPSSYIGWMFRRAPGFMDVVGYAGTSTASNSGQTQIINHNLGVAPEFIIVKRRTGSSNWAIWHTEFATPTSHTFLDGSAELTDFPTYYFSTSGPQPTATQFTVGDAYYTNSTGHNYIAYLWASLPGVSKIGSYIGTGSDVNVDCGFSSGVRFVLIKRVDANSTLLGWFVYDSVRGIVSGNDPYLGLNSTSAEVTSTDYIDPYSAGFTVTASAPADLNASGGKYFYLAIA